MALFGQSSPPPKAWLDVQIRAEDIVRCNLPVNEDFYVGRREDCDIVVNDIFVSRVHFKIYTILFDEDCEPLFYCLNLTRNATLWNDRRLQRHEAVLLDDGDILEIYGLAIFEFHQPGTKKASSTLLSLIGNTKIHENYKLTNRELGNGGYAAVHVAVNNEGRQFAVKIVNCDKAGDTPNKKQELRVAALKEMRIMKELNHPNALRVLEIIESERFFFLIQPLIPGGDLFSYVTRRGPLHEAEAMTIMWQLFTVIDYLHSRKIVHRDIKPDNILLSTSEKNPLVILADFGVARNFDPSGRLYTIVGTECYYAPEIVRTRYRNEKGKVHEQARSTRESTFPFDLPPEDGHTAAVDMWCLGLTLCMLLTNTSPFHGSSKEELMASIMRCNLNCMYEDERWRGISVGAKNIVAKMLCVDERRRLKAREARSHAWFARHVDRLEQLYAKALRREGIEIA